ncbi:MAG: hypothetical protein QOJ79_2587 [Actinomycetota bacterium]|jgi:hypothetical protein|nr:hypothetical protein [Actinomycetota bacterium]
MRDVTAFAAHLRVYEPLAAFDRDERRHWEQYLRAGNIPTVQGGMAMEQAAAVRAVLGRVPAIMPVVGEHAFVTEVDGVTLLCPWRTRIRACEAIGDFRDPLPDELADMFVPRPAAEAAEDELEQWRIEHPDLHTHILSSTWQVPLRWFLLVEADEREVSLGAPAAGTTRVTGRSLVYRTAMSRARRRTARALAVLRRTLDDGLVTAGVEDMGRWLEEFHPRSMVELDYGGLVHLLDDPELRQDESARDIAHALAALSEGDAVRAGGAYGRVAARMKALQGVEAAN